MSSVAASPAHVSTARPRGLWELIERSAAVILLLLLSPALIVVACAVRALSGGSPLVAHKRVGQHGASIWIYKFRTMWSRVNTGWIECVDEEPSGLKGAADPRVTHPFAHFLRRHSVDELPQLWNVAAGEMSFIGPRPLTRSELKSHYGVLASEVLSVKPGLSGLWQVSGRSRLSYAERLDLDLTLVRGIPARRHLWIVGRTILDVLRGSDAW